jgi:hypothetical protein
MHTFHLSSVRELLEKLCQILLDVRTEGTQRVDPTLKIQKYMHQIWLGSSSPQPQLSRSVMPRCLLHQIQRASQMALRPLPPSNP